MGIRLEVTTHPNFTVEDLAMQLAESLQGSFDAQQDVQTFGAQKEVERTKVAHLEGTLKEVKEFKEHPPEKVSRMDPLATYNVKMLHADIDVANKRLADWEERILVASDKMVSYQKDSARLQMELKQRKEQ